MPPDDTADTHGIEQVLDMLGTGIQNALATTGLPLNFCLVIYNPNAEEGEDVAYVGDGEPNGIETVLRTTADQLAEDESTILQP